MSSDTELKKRNDTLEVIVPNEDGRKTHHKIPISRLTSIETYGNITISTPLLQLCNTLKLPCYFNTYYSVPIGKFVPASPASSVIVLKQYESFVDPQRKLHLAQSIVMKATMGRMRMIGKYDKKRECNEFLEKIKEYADRIRRTTAVSELRGVEGIIAKWYFRTFRKMLYHLPFGKRSTRPPKDEGNAILSFGNVVLYNKVDSIVYRTSLDQQIGFLHEPHENRASLSLDIAEIFRPLIIDNLILRLDHKGTLLPQHFQKDEFKCYLNKKGKGIWLREWKNYLRSSFRYKPLKRHISVEESIKIECYNLIKYLTKENAEYKPIYFPMR